MPIPPSPPVSRPVLAIRGYKTISKESQSSLDREVEMFLEQGWSLFGPPRTTCVQDDELDAGAFVLYSQTLTKQKQV